MTLPTSGEEFAKLIEYLRKAQEAAAMIAHLKRDYNRDEALQWLKVSENLRHTVKAVTALAVGKYN